jgi:hypothetical protein
MYSVYASGIVVHLPGRIDVALPLLQETRNVQEPTVWRMSGFTREGKVNK